MTLSGQARGVAYLYLTITAASFGGNWVVGRALTDLVPPFAMTFWRWVIAFLLLLPFAWRHVRKEKTAMVAAWRTLLLLGALGSTGFAVLSYWGLQYTAAINASLLNASMPLFILPLSLLMLGIGISTQQAVGLALSLFGVMIIILRGDLDLLMSVRLNPGDLLIVGAVACWSLYTVILRKSPLVDVHPLSLLFTTTLLGILLNAPLYGWEIARGAKIVLRAETVAGLAFLGLFPALIAYICWNEAVRSVGPNTAGLFLNLVPLFTAAFSMAFLGEKLYAYLVVGAAFVLGGVYLCTARQRPTSSCSALSRGP
jgi:drug/metabolite transporter (DMT)-like permease